MEIQTTSHNIVSVPESLYEGCGKAWAVIKDGEVIALRYMGRAPLITAFHPKVLKEAGYKRPATVRVGAGVRRCQRIAERYNTEAFQEYRTACRAELEKLGEVVSGMCSGHRFIKNGI